MSDEAERQALDNMIRIWNKDRWDIDELIEAWANGIQDDVPEAREELG